MLVLISCAKTMDAHKAGCAPFVSSPLFLKEARQIAGQLSSLTVEELEKLLRVNKKIAAENKLRYLDFSVGGCKGTAALLAYDGIVFKKLCPEDFSDSDFRYAQEHLRITSFMYGLLRPLDSILPYRLEGNVKLPEYGGMTMFEFWREKLTELLINDVKRAGGTLCNLASGEMRGLFDWARVKKEVRIVTPEFKVDKDGKLKTVVVYTKMMRGEMTRYILKNRIENPDLLKGFESAEGFSYSLRHSTADYPIFTI